MHLQSCRMIACDLDGTLLPSGAKTVSPAVRKAVQYIRECGVLFVIATGRDWRGTQPIIRDLGITTPVILQTGGIILDPVSASILRITSIRSTLELQLRRFHVPNPVDCFRLKVGGRYELLSDGERTSAATYGGEWLLRRNTHDDMVIPPNVNLYARLNSSDVIKYLYIGPETLLRDLSQRMAKELCPAPRLILWPPGAYEMEWYLEVFDPATSKGQALQWLANGLNIDSSQIIAIGDGDNDLDMLRYAGFGVAIAGATSTVLNAAKLILPGPEEDGAAKFFLKIRPWL